MLVYFSNEQFFNLKLRYDEKYNNQKLHFY